MRPQDLHVVSVISNPVRWESRKRLFKQYLRHIEELGVQQWVIEATFGEREPEIVESSNPRHLHVVNSSELWIKESLINRMVQELPHDWKYLVVNDGDIEFLRADVWAMEVLQALQHFDVIQTWSHSVDLGPNLETIGTATSFMSRYQSGFDINKEHYGSYFHPGYSWAYRRSAWEHLGGLIEGAIAGAGDHHMACSLIGRPEKSIPKGLHPNYGKMVYTWAARADRYIEKNVGAINGTLLHYFHGWKPDRQYWDRWNILRDNQFDPEVDIKRNSHGVIVLAGNKPKLRDDLRKYFRQRNEDAS